MLNQLKSFHSYFLSQDEPTENNYRAKMLAVSILGKKFGCEAKIEVGRRQYENCILFLMK